MVQMTIYRCAFCGDPIPQGRSDKRYHSVSCKQKAYRWRQKMKRYETNALREVGNISTYLNYPETRQDAIDALKAIRDSVAVIFMHNNIRIVK